MRQALVVMIDPGFDRALRCLERSKPVLPQAFKLERSRSTPNFVSRGLLEKTANTAPPPGGSPVRKSRYYDEQIAAALRQPRSEPPSLRSRASSAYPQPRSMSGRNASEHLALPKFASSSCAMRTPN